jgi:hypothetical protein
VGTLRRQLGNKLLNAGASMAFDSQSMHRSYRRAGHRTLSPADAQLMWTLDVVSRGMVRLGLLLMPSRSPAPLR